VKRPAWAVVPAKSLSQGKSRLRQVMADEDRSRFARGLLEHTLDVLSACGLDGVLVATDGDDVGALAEARGFSVLRDRGGGSLARVVDGALGEVAARGGASAVVLMADLPLIEAADVIALLDVLDDHDVALVRDHLGHHTNALAVSPPAVIATCFGRVDSADAHVTTGHAAGLRVVAVANERIAFDVDVPADHLRLTAGRPAVGT
jgi:2-phospho-L-lactate guanylyltransferase